MIFSRQPPSTQDCRGVNHKQPSAEMWDLEFVFQTPQKAFQTLPLRKKLCLLYQVFIWQLDVKV